MACDLMHQVTAYMWLASEFVEHLLDEFITAPIVGFHVTAFPLWKLGYLLDESWLEEDLMNAMAELCYIVIERTDFIYLPTLAFNDARWLYHSSSHIYGPNLTALHTLLDKDVISTIAFGIWDTNHYHGFIYDSPSVTLLHGNSRHGTWWYLACFQLASWLYTIYTSPANWRG